MFKSFADQARNEELSYWNQLQDLNIVPVNSYVYNIDIDCNSPSKYAVVTETEIPIFSCESNGKLNKLANFKNASCCKFRSDGNMILVGTKTGEILLVSPQMPGVIIKVMSAHTKEITKVEYLYKYDPVQKQSASISDDGTLQIWDTVTNNRLHIFSNSKEPLRGLALIKSNPELIATGSLDGFIRVYNYEKSLSPIVIINTQMQVNCLLFPLESDSNIIVSAGKSSIQLWNTANISLNSDNHVKAVQVATPHHMQIMDMCASDALFSGERVLLTCGLDGMIKVIGLADFREIFKYEYPSSLMNIRVLPNCQYIVASGSDNSDNTKSFIYTRRFVPIIIKDKHKEKKELAVKLDLERLNKLTARFCHGNESLNVIENLKLTRCSKFEVLLKKHKHRAMLNMMLNDRDLEKNPQMFKYLIRELDNFGALKQTLANQDERKLNYLFRYIRGFIALPDITRTCLRVLHLVIGLYPNEVLVRQREYVKLKDTMSKSVKKWKKLGQVVEDVSDILLKSEITNSDNEDVV